MTTNLCQIGGDIPEPSHEQVAESIVAIIMAAARRQRELDGRPELTDLVRAAFDEERPALLQLAKEFLLEETRKRQTSGQASQQTDSASQPLLTEFLKSAFDEERPSFVALVREFLATNEKMTEFLRAAYDHEPAALIALIKEFAAGRKKIAPASPTRVGSSDTPTKVALARRAAPMLPSAADAPEWVKRLPGR